MIIEKFGSHYNGLPTKKQSYRQIVNRLQNITNYFLNECNAERYYVLAQMYKYLSERDKKEFDSIIDSMQAFVDYMAYDGMGTTKPVVKLVTNEIPEYKIEEL